MHGLRALRPAAVLVALATGWIVAGLLLGERAELTDAPLIATRLATAAGALGIVAGGTCILRWHLEGAARAWWYGWALLWLGAAWIATSAPGAEEIRADAAASGALAAAVVLTFIGLRSKPVDASISLVRTLAVAGAAFGTVFVAGTALTNAEHASALSGLAMLACLATAGAGAVVMRRRETDTVWLVTTFTALGAAYSSEFLLTTGFGVLGEAIFAFIALTIAAIGAIGALTIEAAGHRSEALHSSIERVEADERLRTVEEVYAHRMHEVRSSVTALAGGVRNLESTDQVDAQLAVALEAELERLRGLVARDDHEADHQLSRFLISASLTPTLEVCASAGWPVSWELDVNERAYGRPADAAQIVHGLVANARRHAPGSPIEVSTAVDGEQVLVKVEDRGPGVTRNQRERIFEAGVRLGTTGEGDGLGLAIARRVAREMLAELWVQPRPGGGATFVLSLRRANASSLDEEASPGLRLAP